MAENAPLITILCTQCSRHAQMRQGALLPEGWEKDFGQYSCSEEFRDLLRSMGLVLEP